MIQIDQCIFDMDGLLLDTENVYTIVTQNIIGRYGHTFDWKLKSQMMGKKEADAAKLLIETLNLSMTVQEYLLERNQGHKAMFPFCKPLPGVLKFVNHLKNHNIPIAVATSSHREAFKLKSSNNGHLFDLFHNQIVCGDDSGTRGKPFPDIFERAAHLLNPNYNPSNCLVFEDAPSGVLAALNAGMNVIWIPDVRMEIDDELARRCLQVLNSMEDFDPASVGLPGY